MLISLILVSCGSSKKEVEMDKNAKPKGPPPLATTHPSGDLCNALHLKSPIKYPKVPIGTSEQNVVKIYLERLHEVSALTASGLYDPLSFYAGAFPGMFPENSFRPCLGQLSSADDVANYCHFRLNFTPHQRKTFKQQLTFSYTINGKYCTRIVDIYAEGF